MINVVILAAGQGKRMRSSMPKILHPLAGKSLLGHVIDTAKQLNPATLTVVYGHGGSQVQAAFVSDTQLTWAEQSQQLGTGHAVKQALSILNEDYPTLVLYGDVPLTKLESLQQLIEAAKPDQLALLTVNLPDPTGYGRIVRQGNEITKIVEHKDANVNELQITEVNTGILVAPTKHLKQWLNQLSNHNAQGEYYLTDIVAMAVTQGVSVVASQPQAIWETLGVNSKSQLAELERIYQRNIADILLEQGVWLADPARIDVRGQLSCGQDVAIDVNCVFEGNVVLGNNVSIGANCVLRDITLEDGAVVLPFCHLEGATVGKHARVGPYARLRPGTNLAEKTHVGNFVEVKNTQLGVGSKANHLTYLGDAQIGANVNIGAGTITCNYDGVNKFQTIIEDNVFIGSDTQLIAPIKVGKGATIGAGTTLVSNAPENQLTFSRARQTTIDGWMRPSKIEK